MDSDYLPFSLVGMSKAEFERELEDVYSIPSDQNSVLSDDEDENLGKVFSESEDLVLQESNESNDDESLIKYVSKNTSLPEPPVLWSQYNITSAGVPDSFTHEYGLSQELLQIENDDNITPYFLFSLFLTNDVIDDIAFQTNLYAEQEFQKSSIKYTPTSTDEVKLFLGINLLMGIKVLPSYRDYWSTDNDLNDPYISKLMVVNRFGWMLSHLHLNNNALLRNRQQPDFDKLYKVGPFIDALQKNFQKHYKPHENIAIDESMIKFKGRCGLKQYMPKKPIKRGFKVWALVGSEGYLYNFDIYTRKSKNYVEHSLGEKVVLRLTEGLEQKKHCLYFDHFFNSYVL